MEIKDENYRGEEVKKAYQGKYQLHLIGKDHSCSGRLRLRNMSITERVDVCVRGSERAKRACSDRDETPILS